MNGNVTLIRTVLTFDTSVGSDETKWKKRERKGEYSSCGLNADESTVSSMGREGIGATPFGRVGVFHNR